MSLKRMKAVNKKYSQEDKYRHHLGLLRTVMKMLDMPETASLTDIPVELEHKLAPLTLAEEKARIYGVAFIRVNENKSIDVFDPRQVTVQVELP